MIAETPGGDPNRTVVIGAHLDSVPEGPGSTTTAAARRDPGDRRGLRRAGPDTSQQAPVHVVRRRGDRARRPDQVRRGPDPGREGRHPGHAQLRHDRIAESPVTVYDGDGTAGPEGPTGSGFIEDVFVEYFASQGLFNEPTAFDGRSDYGPSSPRGSRPADCSPAPSSPRPLSRWRSTAASPTPSSTPATTRPATPSQARATVLGRPHRALAWSRRPDVRRAAHTVLFFRRPRST